MSLFLLSLARISTDFQVKNWFLGLSESALDFPYYLINF
jgi:hypothetical protein